MDGENISAYPQAVTRQMLQNFATGGRCISVIAKHHQAKLQVIDCGTVGDAYEYVRVERHCNPREGQLTLLKPAMTGKLNVKPFCFGAKKCGRCHRLWGRYLCQVGDGHWKYLFSPQPWLVFTS